MDTIITDKVVKFLATRHYPSGKKTYVYIERGARTRKVIRIAPVGSITQATAREIARRYFLNSLTDKPRVGVRFFSDVAEEFMTRYSTVHKKSSDMDRSRLDRYILPALGQLRLNEITRKHVDELHAKIAQSHAVSANRCLTLLVTIFNKAIEWEYTTDNPAQGVRAIKEKSRERFASEKELEKVLAAIDLLRDKSVRVLLKLYLLTAARKNELLGLRWRDVMEDRLIFRDTKTGGDHVVPLSRAGKNLLSSLERGSDDGLVFAGRNGGRRYDIKRSWDRVRRLSGVQDLRLHDLRRTAGSYLAKKGVAEVVIGKILNHSSPKTTRIYTRFEDKASFEAVNELDALIIQSSN